MTNKKSKTGKTSKSSKKSNTRKKNKGKSKAESILKSDVVPYKDDDQKGEYTKVGKSQLEINKEAKNFTDWMYSQIKPCLKGDILEIGSGIGTYSERVIEDFPKSKIILSDIDPEYINYLDKHFSTKNVKAKKIDLGSTSDFRNLNQQFDSVFALNVLEHIKDDVKAMNEVYNVLRPGGRLIVLVPAHMFLYNPIDKAIHHFRRYSRKMVRTKVKKTKFKILDMFYFNCIAIPGWFLYGNILRKNSIGEGSMGLFNKVVPIARFIEKHLFRRQLGYSLIFILEK